LAAPAIPNSLIAPRVTELTLDCSNNVTNLGESRLKYEWGTGINPDGANKPVERIGDYELAFIEAMKIGIPVIAPFPGTIPESSNCRKRSIAENDLGFILDV
jgi:hypothetical protein